MEKPEPATDPLPELGNLAIDQFFSESTKPTTLYPKITGKMEELIRTYKYRNRKLDAITGQYLPGPPIEPLIKYIGTVKLHGTHADLVIEHNDVYRVQSRNRLELNVQSDNYDCAKQLLPKRVRVLGLRDKIVARWKQLNQGTKLRRACPIILAGEWIGPGVQRTVALDKLPVRAFVILSISVNEEWVPVEPYRNIHDEGAGFYNISRGGFYNTTLNIENPGPCKDEMSKLTLEVEAKCPFGKSFGLSGVGEGIVWRPVREDLQGDPQLWLKTKGPLHRVSVKVPKMVNNTDDREKALIFAESVITEMRLQQAWDYMGEMGINRDKSNTPIFNIWLVNDVEVEERLEIARLAIEKAFWKGAIINIGKKWYFEKLPL